ncbi:cyclic nucleotide-binding protein [Actinomycetota bacterium]|nr:cyclic nucleotide-binding protein [Actinomycetota bacterium]
METLQNCPLFLDIDKQDILPLLDCLKSVQKTHKKNSFVFRAGDKATTVGIVLKGNVHVMQEDFWGNRTILANIESGGVFAEAFSCSQTNTLPISVIAASAAEVLLLDYQRIITSCSSACAFHTKLIKNMLKILAGNNIRLTQKMEHITQRTTRQKLLSYLSEQAKLAKANKANSFYIPFDRQQLADYLSVDRSALSNELSKMRQDGLLLYHKNHFELL